MEEAASHWSRATVVSDSVYDGVRLLVLRVASEHDDDEFGFAQSQLSHSAHIIGTFTLVRRHGNSHLDGYTQRGDRLFEFASRNVGAWDWQELHAFSLQVAEQDFNYPPDYGVREVPFDLRSQVEKSKKRLVEKLGKS